MANAQAIEHILSQVANATLADMASSFASSFLGQDIFTAACHLYMVYRDEERSPISNTVSLPLCSHSHHNSPHSTS
jgi:hypothetical protein